MHRRGSIAPSGPDCTVGARSAPLAPSRPDRTPHSVGPREPSWLLPDAVARPRPKPALSYEWVAGAAPIGPAPSPSDDWAPVAPSGALGPRSGPDCTVAPRPRLHRQAATHSGPDCTGRPPACPQAPIGPARARLHRRAPISFAL